MRELFWSALGIIVRALALALQDKKRTFTHQRIRANFSEFVLTSVLTWPVFKLMFGRFTYKKRRGRESNPRIAVLQTATLPLGYPAISEKTQTILARRTGVNVESE